MSHRTAPHRSRRGFTLLELIIVIVIIGIISGIAITGLQALKDKQIEARGGQVAEEAVTPTPVPEPREPADFTILWGTLIVLGGIGALGAGGAVTYRQMTAAGKDRATRKAVDDALRTRWLRANNMHKAIESDYGTYLLDLREVFQRPLLNDVSVPETAAFLRAYSLLGDSEIKAVLTDEAVSAYEKKAADTLTAWNVASDKATKVGLKSFATEDRRKVERAMKLLNLALDPGASDAERTSAYEQVKKLVDGLIVIPAPTLLQLETAVRKTLTAA